MDQKNQDKPRFFRLKNTLGGLKQTTKNKLIKIKTKAQNGVQNFRENVSEARNKPRSKRESLFLGFTTVLGIFGVTLLVPVLPAVAKDLPTEGAKPSDICPSPTPEPSLLPSERIIGGLSGTGVTIYALASSSVPFVVGAVGALILVIVILKAQNK